MTIVRGFCTNKEHVPALKAYGISDKLIYVDGRGAEDLAACIATFRGRPGKLLIAPDLRVFGSSKKAVTGVMAQLERAKIQVIDVLHPQDETVSEMIQRASVLISGSRFRDRRTARRRGAAGGEARGLAEQHSRAGIAPEWLVRNIVAESSIAWPVKLRLLGGKISQSTLRRHYLVPA